ncbi:MAG: SRPBCC domain-containing protein [Xanthobacteraceae bacterium]|nr:SRPBCC domain-containing protein [Xanthobacteraceae bacterium]MBX3522260.1 SRPBCC domain-containing protein [Xanthobacteraceae bacterium]MBX3535731.1 SRPBCC domain-containing protein [Xanthobacteraceae bacterium]MBX3549123.1 SRPBCC domain-containing protein [Xanthobacteraceae bacterium]MCW5675310.1 SRPBCC domain-containing protein [Xanthobacteraceae bacterium]
MSALVVKRSYSFPAGRVFDAWLTPEITRRWLFTTDGSEVVRCEIDARVGGKFEIVDKRDSGEFKGEIRHVGEYLEIDRPRRLVFTFGVPQFDPRMTRVEIDIVAKGSGCELTLTHHDVPPEWQQPTNEGWTKLLGNLEREISAR